MSSAPQHPFPGNDLAGYQGRFPKILFHCHVFPADPGKFPPDPATGLLPGSVEHLRALASRLGFDRVMAISPSEVPPGRATARIDEGADGLAWLAQRAKHDADILLFANLNPDNKRSPDRVAKAHEDGFTGVKLHPVIGQFAIDAARDSVFYGVLNTLRMPLLIHTGVIPHLQPWPISEHHPFRIDALANKYPNIPVVLAHGGGRPFCREVLAVMQANENTYLDLTHVLDRKYAWHIPLDDLQAFFDQIGPERIIYGTDYPWYRPDDLARDLEVLKSLGVDRSALDMLMGGTFLKLLTERAD